MIEMGANPVSFDLETMLYGLKHMQTLARSYIPVV